MKKKKLLGSLPTEGKRVREKFREGKSDKGRAAKTKRESEEGGKRE